jgi:hypothetical protein
MEGGREREGGRGGKEGGRKGVGGREGRERERGSGRKGGTERKTTQQGCSGERERVSECEWGEESACNVWA